MSTTLWIAGDAHLPIYVLRISTKCRLVVKLSGKPHAVLLCNKIVSISLISSHLADFSRSCSHTPLSTEIMSGMFEKREDDKAAAEKMKENTDYAVESIKSGAEKVGEQIKRAIDGSASAGDDAKEKTHEQSQYAQEKAHEAQNRAASGAQDAINHAQNAGETMKDKLDEVKH